MPSASAKRWGALGAAAATVGAAWALWPVPAPEPAATTAATDARAPSRSAPAQLDAPTRAPAGRVAPEAASAVDAGLAPPPDAGAPAVSEPTDASTAAAPPDAGSPAVLAVPSLDAGTFADLAELEAGAPITSPGAQPTPGTDPRFGLRWSLPGHCGPGFEKQMAARASLLATFPVTTLQGARFFHDPAVEPMRVLAAGDALVKGRSITTGLLGPDAAVGPPDIYLYATAEALRSTSCVNQATAGYYDGAIHVSADDFDLERTVIHENVHHVLNSLGVTKPMWLHEGLAMFAAEERWWHDERLGLTRWLSTQHLPFESLALAFPHSSDELFAGAVYYQSFRMVEFVFVLSPDRGGIYRLVAGLRAGSIQPQSAFSQSSGLSGEPLERSWKQFLSSR